MSRLPARPAHAGGFTLLEMLISVSLLALIITLAYGSLRVAAQSSRSGEALIERTEELRTTQSFLRRQINQMLSIPYERLEDNGEEKRFEGSSDGMTFVAPMPGYLSRGGAHVQRLELVNGDKGLQLQFRFAQLNGFDPARGMPDVPEPVVLIDGIRSGTFEYRSLGADGNLGDWSEEWELAYAIPLMVRLRLEFEQDDRRQWVEFDAGVRIATSTINDGGPLMTPRAGPSPGPFRPREAP